MGSPDDERRKHPSIRISFICLIKGINMEKTRKFHFELEQFYPGLYREKSFDLFADYKAWSKSEFLRGETTIVKPGEGYPQGLGAVRSLAIGRMTIVEDIAGFIPHEYFSYSTYNGSMPVNDFSGGLFFEDKEDGLFVKYKGSFNPEYFGTGRLFSSFLRRAQKSAYESLGKVYKAHHDK